MPAKMYHYARIISFHMNKHKQLQIITIVKGNKSDKNKNLAQKGVFQNQEFV
jgi:hypothetical protein